MSSRFLPLCLLSLGVVGCGGSVYESGADGGGGTSSGGSHQGSGGVTASGGQSPGTGGVGTGAGGADCCLADAVCNEGDTQIDSKDDCPPGATCYSSSMCCSTVWCIDESPITCDAYPVCQENEFEVKVCPESAACKERTLCGSTILCQVDECDREAEPSRTYVANSPEECALVDFDCNSDANYFSNACGCGCEECPTYLDCMPRSCPPNTPDCVTGTDPRCATPEWCPNTMRTY